LRGGRGGGIGRSRTNDINYGQSLGLKYPKSSRICSRKTERRTSRDPGRTKCLCLNKGFPLHLILPRSPAVQPAKLPRRSLPPRLFRPCKFYLLCAVIVMNISGDYRIQARSLRVPQTSVYFSSISPLDRR